MDLLPLGLAGRTRLRCYQRQFRANDRAYLQRRYFNHLRAINRARRPLFSVGGYFPLGEVLERLFEAVLNRRTNDTALVLKG